jgi:hypothetical protein
VNSEEDVGLEWVNRTNYDGIKELLGALDSEEVESRLAAVVVVVGLMVVQQQVVEDSSYR